MPPPTDPGIVHLVFGPQGAGKTTYSRRLESEARAVRFSIDEWMIRLYGPDLPTPLDFEWIMQRVRRCEERIWATGAAVARQGGNVILDLGFTKAESRTAFKALVDESGLTAQWHFVDAPHDLRRRRVLARNATRGETYAFEVTPGMFDFMEKEFEQPTSQELARSIVSRSR